MLENGLQFQDGAEVCTDDPQILGVDVAQVKPPPMCIVGTDGDERAQAAERVDAPLEGFTTDVLDHDVDAALPGPPLRFFDEVLPPVVHDVVGAERPGELDLVVGPNGADDARAAEAGDLDRGAPDAAPRRLHEHGLAGPEPDLSDE